MILGIFICLIIALLYIRHKCGIEPNVPVLNDYMTQSMLCLVIAHLAEDEVIMNCTNYGDIKKNSIKALKKDILFFNNARRLYEIVYTTKFNLYEENTIDNLLNILINYRNKLNNPFRNMIEFLDKLKSLKESHDN